MLCEQLSREKQVPLFTSIASILTDSNDNTKIKENIVEEDHDVSMDLEVGMQTMEHMKKSSSMVFVVQPMACLVRSIQ